MILFFDCETTGLANLKLPPSDSSQPRIVQLAAILTDDKGIEISSFKFLVNPEIEIHEKATAVHGITTKFAREHGVYTDDATLPFLALAGKVSLFVAHNIDFDAFVMDCEIYGGTLRNSKNLFCTMKEMTNICRLPSPWKGVSYKWPKLSEAYEFCFHKKLEKAHDALADVRACKEVYFWLKAYRSKNSIKTQPANEVRQTQVTELDKEQIIKELQRIANSSNNFKEPSKDLFSSSTQPAVLCQAPVDKEEFLNDVLISDAILEEEKIL